MLVAPTELVLADYFNRDDKQPMYQVIQSLPEAERTLANVQETLAYANQKRLSEFSNSPFKCLVRHKNEDFETRLKIAEKHFFGS